MSETEATTGMSAIEAAANALKGDKSDEAAVTTQGEPADDEALGEGGKKALKAEREARTAAEREAAELKAKLDKIEAANMSDLERAQKAAAEAQAELEKLPNRIADELREHLAEVHGISDEDRALYLTSSDPATLRKQALGIAERRATATTTTPKPDLTQGAQRDLALNSDGLTEALSRAVGARP